MVPDYHLHTPLCKHAEGDIAGYAARARRLGMREIGVTDHAPAPDGYDPTNRMEMDQFDRYREAVAAAAAESRDVAIRYGIEADYYAGCERFLETWLPNQEFDLVIGSVHYLGDWGFDNPDQMDGWKTVNVEEAWRHYFEKVAAMARAGLYDVVGHLDLPKKFGFRPSPEAVVEMAAPALDAVAEAGMAVEINTGGLRKPCAEIYPSPALLRLCREREIGICFGSDAHRPDDVGYAFEEAIRQAREAGYTDSLVFRRRRSQRIPLP